MSPFFQESFHQHAVFSLLLHPSHTFSHSFFSYLCIMNTIFTKLISESTGISQRQVAGTVALLEEGCTIPFISRYRKEVTGALDEVQVASVSEQLEKMNELAKRKETIYPHPPKNERRAAADKLWTLTKQYKIEAISIGNGTASRETEEFVRGLGLPKEIQIFVVSEDGASIYSASKVAREEFPDYDVTVRGAVSIGRRLMDPLAELVKIDPNSIGVGQYQKDVDQKELKHSLDQTVEFCVNKVGVNVNTASKHLLTYISGLGPAIAQNIVTYRAENGAFTSRKDLLKVPKLGPKAYEQAAGFLRVTGGKQPLDNSAVHPESYPIVERMAKDQHCSVAELMADKELRSHIDIQRYVTDKVGLPTLEDIMQELDKPGRDPRQQLTVFEFSKDVKELEDVQVGMVLPGIITNITNFGCFVDVGVHTKGLVHISELADHFVKDPSEEVQLHQHVTVRVIGVDLQRGRLQLSMKGL